MAAAGLGFGFRTSRYRSCPACGSSGPWVRFPHLPAPLPFRGTARTVGTAAPVPLVAAARPRHTVPLGCSPLGGGLSTASPEARSPPERVEPSSSPQPRRARGGGGLDRSVFVRPILGARARHRALLAARYRRTRLHRSRRRRRLLLRQFVHSIANEVRGGNRDPLRRPALSTAPTRWPPTIAANDRGRT